MKDKIIAVILILLLMLWGTDASVYAENKEAAVLADEIIGYKLEAAQCDDIQQWIDTVLAENAGTSAEWYIIALESYGDYDFSAYADALENYLAENEIKNPVSEKKYAVALAAAGKESDHLDRAADNTENQGLMSLIYSLHLANNGFGDTSAAEIAEMVISMQKEDGGWAVMGNFSDTDVTAMAVQGLAPLYDDNSAAASAVDKALELLSSRQLAEGDYEGMGIANAESTAQVICALSALEIDCTQDERFIKNGNTLIDGLKKYRIASGQYSHEENGEYSDTATVQALYSLTGADRLSSVYIFDNKDDTVTAETEASVSESVTAVTDEIPEEEQSEQKDAAGNDIKTVIIIVIAAVFSVGCGIMIIRRKNFRNVIALAAAGAVLIIAVIAADIKSPEDYYSGERISKENPVGTVTISISCHKAAEKSEAQHIPRDGIILDTVSYDILQGETVYDILTQAAQEYGISVETEGQNYVSGINQLYEFDFGELSGWIFHVNGTATSKGCEEYVLSDGDEIEWLYSCELGNDLTGENDE